MTSQRCPATTQESMGTNENRLNPWSRRKHVFTIKVAKHLN